jgi:hypothetical protein
VLLLEDYTLMNDNATFSQINPPEVEFVIEVRTIESVSNIGKMCTSEYPYGRGERRLRITKESAYRW